MNVKSMRVWKHTDAVEHDVDKVQTLKAPITDDKWTNYEGHILKHTSYAKRTL